jgi:hypothetical protein
VGPIIPGGGGGVCEYFTGGVKAFWAKTVINEKIFNKINLNFYCIIITIIELLLLSLKNKELN